MKLQLYTKNIINRKNNHINYYNFGTFYFKIGNPKEALIYLYKAFELNKNFHKVQWNISLCELKLGNFKKGFSLYDYRWKIKIKIKIPINQRIKNLKDISNSRLLFWGDGDGGYGDNIQFSRFVIYLSKKIRI